MRKRMYIHPDSPATGEQWMQKVEMLKILHPGELWMQIVDVKTAGKRFQCAQKKKRQLFSFNSNPNSGGVFPQAEVDQQHLGQARPGKLISCNCCTATYMYIKTIRLKCEFFFIQEIKWLALKYRRRLERRIIHFFASGCHRIGSSHPTSHPNHSCPP